SSDVRGLPRIMPSRATTVSAAMMIAGPTARAATSSTLAEARRLTRSPAVSPGNGVSSTAEESTLNGIAASRRMSARRDDEEARITSMGTPRKEYYSNSASRRRPQQEHYRLLILAKHTAQGIGDFPTRSVAFHGPQNPRQKFSAATRPPRKLRQ